MQDKQNKCPFCNEEASGVKSVHRAGILTDYEIQKYKLISNIAADGLKGTTYNLRLGEGHYVFAQAEADKPRCWTPVWLNQSEEARKESNKHNPQFEYAEYLTVEPFSAAIIQLKEIVDTKTCIASHDLLICGRFDLRLAMVAKGLISQQATQVEPNYKGKLFCYLFNQTAVPIKLKYLDEIATIEFSYVSCAIHNSPDEKRSLLEKSNESSRKKYQTTDGKAIMFCTPDGIDDVRYFATVIGGDSKLSDRGSSINDYVDKAAGIVVKKELSDLENKWVKRVIKTIGVFTVIVLLFGNNVIERYLIYKAEDAFKLYFKESTSDRGPFLQKEINKEIDDEMKKSAPDRERALREEVKKILAEERKKGKLSERGK